LGSVLISATACAFGYDWELQNPLEEIEQEIRKQTSEIQSALYQQE
jgi:hypothetical protein